MHLNELIHKFSEFVSLELKSETIRRTLLDLRHLCIYLRNPLIENITEQHILEYIHLMKELGWTHNGIVTKTRAYSRLFTWAYDRDYPTLTPKSIPRMRQIPTMPKVATEDEVDKVLNAIPTNKPFFHTRDQAIIRMLWDTGARVGELASLNADDLDLKEMCAVIRTEKSRGLKPFREIYWTETTNFWLTEWLEIRQKMVDENVCENPEALWIGRVHNWYGKRLTTGAFGIILRQNCKRAKVRILNPHSFRHRMGHHLSEQGANNSVISSVLGHSNLSSSYIYTELNNKERRGAYNKYVRKNTLYPQRNRR